MEIVDAQLHDPAPWLKWSSYDIRTGHDLLTELVLAYLDALGIWGAILVPGDEEWVEAAANTQPSRLAYILRVNPRIPDLDRFVAETKGQREAGLLALRASIGWPLDGSEVKRFEEGVWDPVFTTCEKYQVPVFLMISGWLPLAAAIAQRHPDLTIIIDHLGLHQPPRVKRESPPLKSLPELLALARYPNVAVKLCGLPALSNDAFPYTDVVPHLRSIVDAFGATRLMWASDISRFYGRMGLLCNVTPGSEGQYPGKHTYAESLNFIRHCDQLTPDEKEAILGKTVHGLLGWPRVTPSDS
jgi:predicted TIM-barrel fold metal-dependent hydrolase